MAGVLLQGAHPAAAQEWNRFRGPNGSGVSQATTVPVTWSEDDFRWRVKLRGVGHSSPVLWGRRIFVTAGDEETGTRQLICVEADDGRIVWSKQYDASKHRKHQLNSFASSTPAAEQDAVYLCWAAEAESIVAAYDHKGTRQWRRSLGPFEASHGFGVSPVVFEDLLIVGNEHEGQSSIVALERRSGTVRWRIERDTKVAYSTPVVYQPAGGGPVLIFTNWKHGITALDPRTGKTRWERSVFDQGHIETAISSPIVAGDLVLGTCGWLGYGMQTVAVRPDDSQPGSATELFRVDRGAPLTTTPVAVDGLLFLWADNGIVTCSDAKTGQRFWQRRVGGTYYGSPVVVGDAVYCLNTGGQAVVLAASKEYRLLARNPLGEASHSTPAVAHGTMYLRTFSRLMAVGGPAASP